MERTQHTQNASTSSASAAVRPASDRWRRATVRIFFLLFAIVLFVETSPSNWKWAGSVRQWLDPTLNACGLGQGRWTLFAPNPILNNAWLSAEVYRPDGTRQEVWNSTYWAKSSGWERFVGFRHMNFRNRMGAIDPRAADDFADYLARELISPTARPVNVTSDETTTSTWADNERQSSTESGPTPAPPSLHGASQRPWRLVLTRSKLSLVLPDDGTLPKRDETMWISSSKNLAVREYLP